MLKKALITSFVVLGLLIGACAWWGDETTEMSDEEVLIETATQKAKALYEQKKAAGEKFTDGPCLGVIMEDWVADIAHNPRLPIDNRPENQCPEFRAGEAHHFVELDPEGNFVRAQ